LLLEALGKKGLTGAGRLTKAVLDETVGGSDEREDKK
jgi:hypothetical protein